MTKATAQMGGLTREEINQLCDDLKAAMLHWRGDSRWEKINQLCDLALQATKNEPVAWMCQMYADSSKVYFFTTNPDLRDDSPWDRITPLFAAPPPPERP